MEQQCLYRIHQDLTSDRSVMNPLNRETPLIRFGEYDADISGSFVLFLILSRLIGGRFSFGSSFWIDSSCIGCIN